MVGVTYRNPPCPFSMCIFPVYPATAPQQEADTEVNTEALNKSSQSSTSSTQAATPDTASASKEKEAATEKSKDSSGSVSTSRPLARGTYTSSGTTAPKSHFGATRVCQDGAAWPFVARLYLSTAPVTGEWDPQLTCEMLPSHAQTEHLMRCSVEPSEGMEATGHTSQWLTCHCRPKCICCFVIYHTCIY